MATDERLGVVPAALIALLALRLLVTLDWHRRRPPSVSRRGAASHEDQIVNLGPMATDFPQYRMSFDRAE